MQIMRSMEKRGQGGGIFDFLSHKGGCLLVLKEQALGMSYSRKLGLEGTLEGISFGGFQPFVLM